MTRRTFSGLRFKWLKTKQYRRYNLFRANWERGSAPGSGIACGYSTQLTVGFSPYFWRRYNWDKTDFSLIVAGMLFSYSRSYGGKFG